MGRVNSVFAPPGIIATRTTVRARNNRNGVGQRFVERQVEFVGDWSGNIAVAAKSRHLFGRARHR